MQVLNLATAMKYPESHKQEVNKRLRSQAAAQFREKGMDAVSVKSVMAAEGMTVGGFYAHFDSKEALIIEALKSAFKDSDERFYKLLDQQPDENWLPMLLKFYLSEMHRDNVEHACPVSCLMGDIARQGEEVKQVFQSGFEELIRRYTQRFPGDDRKDIKAYAIGLTALLAGGIQLSRAVADEECSDEILQACVKTAEALFAKA